MNRTSSKTLFSVLMACILALLLTACGANEAQDQGGTLDTGTSRLPVETGQDTDSAANTKKDNADTTDGFSLPFTLKQKASLLDIANDYLSGERKLTNLYTESSDGWIRVKEAKQSFKPGAVYPYDTWTTEDIIASYLDATAPWTGSGDDHRLWSADYTHDFAIEDYIWCYIDGEYAGTVPHQQYSMDPQELIRLYQSGEWSGEEPIWSEDDSTYVTVQWREPNSSDTHRNGCLRYEFVNFTEEVDVRPWWDSDDSYELEPYYMAHTVVGEGEDAFLKYDEVLVPLYVDLPNGELTDHETFGEVLQIVPCSSEGGVLVYTTKGIWLFKAGDLVLGWPSESAAELAALGYQQ